MEPVDGSAWAEWSAACRADYKKGLIPDPGIGDLDMGAVMMQFKELLPDDAIVTVDAGNFSG